MGDTTIFRLLQLRVETEVHQDSRPGCGSAISHSEPLSCSCSSAENVLVILAMMKLVGRLPSKWFQGRCKCDVNGCVTSEERR